MKNLLIILLLHWMMVPSFWAQTPTFKYEKTFETTGGGVWFSHKGTPTCLCPTDP